jgi:hypothetical protein
MYVLYYALMFFCCHLIWILVRTGHPYLGVGYHSGRGGAGWVVRDGGEGATPRRVSV